MNWPPSSTIGITQFLGFWHEPPSDDEYPLGDSSEFSSFLVFCKFWTFLIGGKGALNCWLIEGGD